MKLDVLCLGPLRNNVIILSDDVTGKALVFDPSFDSEEMLEIVKSRNLTVESLLFTHGHFDHFAGLAHLIANLSPRPKVGLHKAELPLWQAAGGAAHWQVDIQTPEDPDFWLEEGVDLNFGAEKIQVRHTPGHSLGSVIFYLPWMNTAVVGDLIFKLGVGRTDLPGGDFSMLQNSILTKVFTLPPATVLISGHGPSTTVADEMEMNPYVNLAG